MSEQFEVSATHDLPPSSSDDPLHDLALDCWCNPNVVVENGVEWVRHNAEAPDA